MKVSERVKVTSLVRFSVNILGRISDSDFFALKDHLNSLPMVKNEGDLLRVVKPINNSLKKKEVLRIIDFLIEVDTASRSYGASFEVYTENILLSICEDDNERLKVQKRIGELKLNTKFVSLVAKAKDLWSELPRKLIKSRILSDIRPIFGDSLGSIPVQGVVVHTLVLTFIEGDEEKEFHVNFDQNGISKLAGILNRATDKERLIGSAMENMGGDIVRPF